MREYRFQATDQTLEALRRLRASWAGYVVGEMSFTVHLADGNTVRIEIEPADVEGVFDAYRVSASVNAVPRTEAEMDGDTPKDWPTGPIELPEGFASGGNDVVLFTGASWSEPGSADIAAQLAAQLGTALDANAVCTFSGNTTQVTDSAEIVCITTDALVIASVGGDGLLLRAGLKPESVQIVRDPGAVRAFLKERSYVGDD